MEKIIIFFIYHNPFVVTFNIETSDYITFNSLYPFTGIRGDYFSEDQDFFEEESLFTIKEFMFTNLLPYHIFNRNKTEFRKNLTEKKLKMYSKEFERAVKDYAYEVMRGSNPFYFSYQSISRLLSNMAKYARLGTHCYKDISNCSSEQIELETMLKTVLETGVDDVLLLDYDFDENSGLNCTRKLELSTENLPEEKLIQEIFLWKYTAPRLGIGNLDPLKCEDFQNYFRKRFNSFSERTKWEIMVTSSVDPSLQVYKQALSEWNRERIAVLVNSY